MKTLDNQQPSPIKGEGSETISRKESREKSRKGRNFSACVYYIIDPRTSKIRYVGKTVKKLESRLAEHLQDSKRSDCRISRLLRKIVASGYTPIIKPLYCTFDHDRVLQKEKHFIRKFKSKGIDLCNHTEGGDGRTGFKHTERVRSLISEALKGKKKTETHIQKMRENFSIPLYLYDEEGKYEKTFSSSKEAGRELGCHPGTVLSASRRNGTCCGGRLVRHFKVETVPTVVRHYKSEAFRKMVSENNRKRKIKI